MINGNAREGSRAFPHASLLVQIFQLLVQCSFYGTTGFKTICTSLQRDAQLEGAEPTGNCILAKVLVPCTLEIGMKSKIVKCHLMQVYTTWD